MCELQHVQIWSMVQSCMTHLCFLRAHIFFIRFGSICAHVSCANDWFGGLQRWQHVKCLSQSCFFSASAILCFCDFAFVSLISPRIGLDSCSRVWPMPAAPMFCLLCVDLWEDGTNCQALFVLLCWTHYLVAKCIGHCCCSTDFGKI